VNYLSKPCACRAQRVPYLNNVVVTNDGEVHRLTHCSLPRIEVMPDAPAAGWRLLNHTCEHGATWWATGPDPLALLAEHVCGCEVAA
jgi:hypothetical protein